MDRTRVVLFLQLLGEVCSHCSARTYCSSNIYWLINSFAMQFDLGYISWDLRIRHSQVFFHFCKAEKCAQNLDEVIIIQCRCNSPVLLDSMCLDRCPYLIGFLINLNFYFYIFYCKFIQQF